MMRSKMFKMFTTGNATIKENTKPLKGRKERNERETNKSKEKRPYHPRL